MTEIIFLQVHEINNLVTDQNCSTFAHNFSTYFSCSQFFEKDFILRTPRTHDEHCDMLDGPTGLYDSTTYGVNRRSVLNQVDYFNVASGQLPQDVMHVLYEGVLPLNVKLMLHRFISEEHLFTLKTLNDRIFSFSYGRNEARNKPSKCIEQGHLDGSKRLPFSGMVAHLAIQFSTTCMQMYFNSVAAQMWTFSTLLPLIIGDCVPVDHPAWECFLTLLRISKFCTARVVSSTLAEYYLSSLIDQHHQQFRICYPNVNMTPKMHYMVHFPQQILKSVLGIKLVFFYILCLNLL